MPVGIKVETGETPQSAGISLQTGTGFAVYPAVYGPETPQLIRSLGEAVTLYGPREGESVKLYDALNAFFSVGGARAYVNRVAGEGSPAVAKLEIETTGTAKVLIVSAKYKGTYGNNLKIEVKENGAKTKTALVILNPEGEVLETSEEFAKAEELLAWGKKHETYVVVSAGSGYEAGKGEKLKVLTSTKLASGANPTANEAAYLKTLEAIPRNLGPGQLFTGSREEGVQKAMAEHAAKNNRFALVDLKKAEEEKSTVLQLKEEREKATPGGNVAPGYMATFSSACTASGLTLGTTRTIPTGPVMAGMFAKIAAKGNDNVAPAGRGYTLSPFVTGFTNTFTEAQINELNEGNVNSMAERFGVLCCFGDVTALSNTKDLIFYQYTAARERMHLVAECEEVAEKFVFSQQDGRHQKRSMFAGELGAVIKRQWELGALYGESANESGLVNVGEPVNTPATEQNGELNAELIVRISPAAVYVKILIVSTPITETV